MRLAASSAAVVALLLIAGIADAGSITYFDGTFDDADWAIVVPPMGDGGVTTARQVSTGGNLGPFREITNVLVSPEIFGFHGNLRAIYNPSILGPITSIDYYEDALLIDGFGQGQATGPALMQDGYVYFRRRFITPDRVWTPKSVTGMTAGDFLGYPDTSLHPDFSDGAAPIQLGFWRANSGGGYTIVAGIDNWTFTIDGPRVPEPASAALLTLGLLVLGAILWRRSPGRDRCRAEL